MIKTEDSLYFVHIRPTTTNTENARHTYHTPKRTAWKNAVFAYPRSAFVRKKGQQATISYRFQTLFCGEQAWSLGRGGFLCIVYDQTPSDAGKHAVLVHLLVSKPVDALKKSNTRNTKTQQHQNTKTNMQVISCVLTATTTRRRDYHSSHLHSHCCLSSIELTPPPPPPPSCPSTAAELSRC